MKPVTECYNRAVAAGRLTPDPAQQAVLGALDRVANDLNRGAPPRASGWRSWFGAAPAPEPMRGLYLWGGVGRGKSMLMDLLTEAVDQPARRVHFHAFMQEVQAGLNKARQSGQADALRPVAESIAAQTRLLCFDEMQITDIADAMIVGRLFEILFEKGVMIVTTSNRVPDDLYKDGLNRQLFLPFIALLKKRMQVIELVSPRDYRQNRLGGDQVWFSPDDARAEQAMDAVWAEATAAHGQDRLILDVHGRRLDLPRAGTAVRAGFETLCGRALGAADYLALAEAAETLLIDHIPLLGPDNFDRAKRFVTLIDTLYEARTRVIASAAAAPEALYPTGTGSFEFERTASRLREMQAADWGREEPPQGAKA